MAEPLAITFVLPVMDETESLVTTAETIFRTAGEHVRELLVVTADRTTPESLAVVERLAAEHSGVVRVYRQQRPGLGRAMAEAFAVAAGTHVMLMASDLETDPEAIPRFVAKMQEGHWDIVCGSRWLAGGGFSDYGPVRVLLNWLFQQCVRLLYGTRLTDLTYAYRLYRREALEGIAWDEAGHAFLLECLLKPLRCGARAVEVPCPWRRRPAGRSAGSLRQTLRYLPLAVRLRWWRGC